MKKKYCIMHMLYVLLSLWIVFLIVISLCSQAKRFLKAEHHIYQAEELSCSLKHIKEKEYSCVEKKNAKQYPNMTCLSIGETACYWSNSDVEAHVKDDKLQSDIYLLTFSRKETGLKALLHRQNSVTYLRYGCKDAAGFSEEEKAYYASLAARRFTYNVYEKWNFDNADSYLDFVENENQW